MERITRKQLDHLVTELNKALGTPTEAWRTTKDGRRLSNIGHVWISHSITGFCIVQMTNETGMDRNLGHDYRMTTRETWKALRCMIDAVAIAKNGGAKCKEQYGAVEVAQ